MYLNIFYIKANTIDIPHLSALNISRSWKIILEISNIDWILNFCLIFLNFYDFWIRCIWIVTSFCWSRELYQTTVTSCFLVRFKVLMLLNLFSINFQCFSIYLFSVKSVRLVKIISDNNAMYILTSNDIPFSCL